jgi:hypothetical protein
MIVRMTAPAGCSGETAAADSRLMRHQQFNEL